MTTPQESARRADDSQVIVLSVVRHGDGLTVAGREHYDWISAAQASRAKPDGTAEAGAHLLRDLKGLYDFEPAA